MNSKNLIDDFNSEINWLNRAYRLLNKTNQLFTLEELKLLISSPHEFLEDSSLINQFDFRFKLDEHDSNLDVLSLDAWYQNPKIDEIETVVIDIETSGSTIGIDRIFEIGAIKMVGTRVVDQFYQLVNCQKSISPYVIKLTNVDLNQLVKAPVIEDVLPELMDFIGTSIFVAHNCEFDFNFVLYEAQRIGVKAIPIIDICTWLLSQSVLADETSKFGLSDLGEFHNVNINDHHRALYDAKMAANLLCYMWNKLKKHNVTHLFDVVKIEQTEFQKFYKPRKRLKRVKSQLFSLNSDNK